MFVVLRGVLGKDKCLLEVSVNLAQFPEDQNQYNYHHKQQKWNVHSLCSLSCDEIVDAQAFYSPFCKLLIEQQSRGLFRGDGQVAAKAEIPTRGPCRRLPTTHGSESSLRLNSGSPQELREALSLRRELGRLFPIDFDRFFVNKLWCLNP